MENLHICECCGEDGDEIEIRRYPASPANPECSYICRVCAETGLSHLLMPGANFDPATTARKLARGIVFATRMILLEIRKQRK